MKTILKVLVFLCFSFSYAQENFKFYIEIPNNTMLPSVSAKKGGTLKLDFIDNNVNSVFANYTIYKFEEAFPGVRTPKLQTVYYIECNDEELKNTLIQDYSYYFPYAENVPEYSLLYIPNDYIYSGDLYDAKNLDLINVKEAWDYSTGDPDFLIGISDLQIMIDHEDLDGKVSTLYSPTAPHGHGTATAGTAAASTDNSIGIAGVGFNSSILGGDIGVYNLWQLSENGARVVNASWMSGCNDTGSFDMNGYDQLLINEIHENGTVIVVSAGNGQGNTSINCKNPQKFAFPASYNHVISVSSVGSQDIGYVYPPLGIERNWRDHFESPIGTGNSHQYNSKVDIVAPGHGNWATMFPDAGNNYAKYGSYGGTSASAPHVSGGVSLMLTANTCLNPDEVESLLKLTSVNVDSLAVNVSFVGGMGAGRMDIGKATKAAWQMNPANGGEVLLSNRTFDRWNFELLNSPEYIRLKNEGFIENANTVFRAKKGITLDVNTLLDPGAGKSHYLYVENADTCFNFNKSYNNPNINSRKPDKIVNNNIEEQQSVKIYPNPSKDYITIETKNEIHKIEILDISGKLMRVDYSGKKVDINNLPLGNYIVKIYLKNQIKLIKFIKK